MQRAITSSISRLFVFTQSQWTVELSEIFHTTIIAKYITRPIFCICNPESPTPPPSSCYFCYFYYLSSIHIILVFAILIPPQKAHVHTWATLTTPNHPLRPHLGRFPSLIPAPPLGRRCSCSCCRWRRRSGSAAGGSCCGGEHVVLFCKDCDKYYFESKPNQY